MNKLILLLLLAFSFSNTSAGDRYDGPVIDMHLHSYTEDNYWGGRTHDRGTSSPKTAAEHMKQTIEAMDSIRIERAVVSGSLSSTKLYQATDKRFIAGITDDTLPTPDEFEQWIKTGAIQVFGEIGAIYHGRTLADPIYQPYLALCEKYDIPVAYHTGGGPTETYKHNPKFRLVLGNPLLIEEVLINYPKLRIYLMHAGEMYFEEAIRLMMMYPQLYADLGVLLWVNPLPKAYARDFLKRAKEAELLNRVMFGTDQMVWPGAIKSSYEFLNSMTFLTKEEKAAIFYHNAKRFLKLEP